MDVIPGLSAGVSGPLSPDAIKAAVTDMLNQDVNIPPGHRGALVTVVNTDKVEIAVATRVTDNWSVEVVASHDWTGDSQVGAMSKLTW